ncbi:hypothetical protein FQV37_2255 [Psychrobacter nivimaris]|uniref:AP2/ERF domain-containing protein n=1 Tax=Psychrobacter nivimaris TaxID=281738 RepID=A0A6N7BTL2_9GAMM|nr:hypothetical protein [Psychrobacter nivimaris]KAF0567399.1 hypothetical protein FQV37_2255 [Psychrobacter nivimaris]
MKSKIKVGDVFNTNEGYEVEVVKYNTAKDITVRFLDLYRYERTTNQSNLRNGRIKNPYHPSVYGIGFIGEGPFKTQKNGKRLGSYSTWQAMLNRCYSEKSLKFRPSYHDCEVDKNWWNYQNFCQWYYSNNFSGIGYDLDKDVLVSGNKMYSESTCAFVPREINSLLLKCGKSYGVSGIKGACKNIDKYSAHLSNGTESIFLGRFETAQEAHQAYVFAKEAYVKEVANKWRGLIDERVYDALMNWRAA